MKWDFLFPWLSFLFKKKKSNPVYSVCSQETPSIVSLFNLLTGINLEAPLMGANLSRTLVTGLGGSWKPRPHALSSVCIEYWGNEYLLVDFHNVELYTEFPKWSFHCLTERILALTLACLAITFLSKPLKHIYPQGFLGREGWCIFWCLRQGYHVAQDDFKLLI